MTIIPLHRTRVDHTGLNSGAGQYAYRGEAADVQATPYGGIPAVAAREAAAPRDEAELLRGLAASEPAALTAIAQWLWEPLAAYAYRIVEDRDAAMDIVQEALLRLWERRGRAPPECIRPYLFRVTRNLAFDLQKTKRTRRRLLSGLWLGRTDGPARPDEVLQRDRIAAEVHRGIQQLPERRREVFVLTYLQGLSYAEVADVLGISAKTVQNQMSAALAQLRVVLRPLLDEAAEPR